MGVDKTVRGRTGKHGRHEVSGVATGILRHRCGFCGQAFTSYCNSELCFPGVIRKVSCPQDAAGALDVRLTDSEARRLKASCAPRTPAGFR